MSRPVSDTAAALIAQLGLEPHPEGGHYRETYRHRPAGGGRGHATLIYYLLQAGELARWHRVTDAVEIWLFQAGSPFELGLSQDGGGRDYRRLGTDVANGEEPQIEIPAGVWQSARSLGLYSLAACLVVPAFDFASFEMAPPDGCRGRLAPNSATGFCLTTQRVSDPPASPRNHSEAGRVSSASRTMRLGPRQGGEL